MIRDLSLDDFLLHNRIDKEAWEEASIEWETLKSIGADYERYGPQLREYAGMLARVIQQYDGVHSVRWRIKDSEHVLEKIVRKRAAKADKYLAINVQNYHSIITDLVGIRALHLFKNEAITIDASIRDNQQLIESEHPLVYTRKGDTVPEDIFPKDRFDHREHPAGYRSVHYIIQAQPQKRQIYAEVQVRTIFEEGWSEIDHRVRYPNFTSDEMVNVFLAIFNRLAGQADEMGSFVQALAQVLTTKQVELNLAHDEKRKSFESVDALVAELEQKTQQHVQSQDAVVKLKEELARMRSAANTADVTTPVIVSKKWREQIERASVLGIDLSSSDFAAQAKAVLGGTFDSPFKNTVNLEVVDKVIKNFEQVKLGTVFLNSPAIGDAVRKINMPPRTKKTNGDEGLDWQFPLFLQISLMKRWLRMFSLNSQSGRKAGRFIGR
jgi:ppGpp synthetase/RelA/SpoT-type nucleotidyltranferase